MTTYFPSPYTDELLYSLLSRYYVKSGYLAYAFAANDLYIKKTTNPSHEFINTYTPQALKSITRNIDFNVIIEKHTMFPYYSRFLNKDRRNMAFDSLLNMKENYYNTLYMPKKKEAVVRYLRYCPICASNDRKKYGETYWHRNHQLIGVNVCPTHKCKLSNSNISISSDKSPSLITAEESIPYSENVIFTDNALECRLAQYIIDVFQSKMDMQNDITISKFLHSKLENTKYLSLRGEKRNITLLHSDFCKYYESITDNQFKELWKIQKMFTNGRYSTYEVCITAMFLNIPVNELTHMTLPNKTQQQIFDETIKTLHDKGLNYQKIATHMNASYNLVKQIGEGRYGTYHYNSQLKNKCGAKSLDWEKIDAETLLLIKETIANIQRDINARPVKITAGLMERMLNLPEKRLNHCPMCMNEIKNHSESQEEYWAREVVWAFNMANKYGKIFNFSYLWKLTNIRKQNLLRCLLYIDKHTDSNNAQQIKMLLKGNIVS